MLVLAAACGNALPADPDAAAPPPDPTAAVTDTDVFTETAVWLDADGATRVETRPITVAEERAIAARITAAPGAAQPLIVQDQSCSGGFWLYDQPRYAGNRICFHGAGTVQLAAFGWAVSIGSWFDASTEYGYLQSNQQIDNGHLDATPQVTTGFQPYWYSPFYNIAPLVWQTLTLTN